ncbi:MAG TPA: alpha/beta hydrolase [Gammaproteobacteria bacterium]
MLKIFVALVAGYALIVAGIFFLQHRLVYLPEVPSRAILRTPHDIGLAYEDVILRTADGVALHGWFVSGGDRVLLFLHGNAGNISHRLESIDVFHGLGLSVLIIDYRGYGASEGRPSEHGTYRDADAAWRYLTETREVPPSDIVIFGRSLGGAIAAYLAARTSPGALIVESAFTSIPDLAAELYPWLPARWLSRFDYPTRRFVAEAECPVLVVHSRDDEITPFHHAEAIFAAARDGRALVELAGTHNEAHIRSERQYIAALRAFLEETATARR